MIFRDTTLPDVVTIDIEHVEDSRGFFARTWDAEQFAARGLNSRLLQCSVSFNRKKGTLRGLHYQTTPYAEAKLVRCTMGAVYDVVVDLRRSSPTFTQWVAVELTAANRRMLYIPEGCAHGFQTLRDRSEVFYQMSQIYVPECARGVRWNDPAFGVTWPEEPRVMSEQDRSWPDFVPSAGGEETLSWEAGRMAMPHRGSRAE